LINCAAKIYLVIGKEDEFYKYIITVDTNVGTSEFAAKSLNKYQVGDMVTISDYSNAYYII